MGAEKCRLHYKLYKNDGFASQSRAPGARSRAEIDVIRILRATKSGQSLKIVNRDSPSATQSSPDLLPVAVFRKLLGQRQISRYLIMVT